MKSILTILVPCYNEEAVLDYTINKLLLLLAEFIEEEWISNASKICLINDGSNDNTQNIIEKYAKENEHVACIKLTNNFGHQSAIMAGIETVEADIIITIDADLQDDCTVITQMIEKYKEGYDIVYGVRNKRSSDSFMKKMTAEIFYSFMNIIGVKLIQNHADFRLLSSKAVKYLRQYKEKSLFLRGLIPIIGLKNCNVYYERLARKQGQSKYSLVKMLALALNAIVGFSSFPIRILSIIGLLMIVISFFVLVYGIFNISVFVFIIFMILFFNGINLVAIGIIGEYILKIYKETQNRPLYLVEKTVNI